MDRNSQQTLRGFMRMDLDEFTVIIMICVDHVFK